MAVDLRPFNCLPEHQGPAFRTWARILQTAAMSSGSPTSPLLSPNGYCNFESSFPNLIPAEEFIPFKSDDDAKKLKNSAEKNANTTSSGRAAEGDGLTSPQVEDVSSMSYAPWKSTKGYPENAYGLHLEIKDFYEYMSPSPEESFMRKDTVDRIKNLINGIWPAAKVEIFGSYKTNLYLPTSDIDLVVFGQWEKLPLWTLERALVNQDVAEQSTIKVLDKASVPIVKLTDKRSNIKVDISFNMDTAVKGAELIQEFLKEYKILPCLFLVLKHFLVIRDLNEVFTGGISSYCLMLLTISFLQMHPRQETKLQNANLGVLLIEFFELYGRNFNYQRTGIKIRNGGCYCSKDEIMREMIDGQFPSLLCIEDPVSKVIDIGKSSFGIMRVKEAFEYAYNVLDSALRNRHYFKINPESTYLSRIIHVPREVIQYRKWVKKHFKLPCKEPTDDKKAVDQQVIGKSAETSREINIVNADDFPPLESSNPISKRSNVAGPGNLVTEDGISSSENRKSPLYSSVGSGDSAEKSRKLTLPLSTRLSDTGEDRGDHKGDQGTQDVSEKPAKKDADVLQRANNAKANDDADADVLQRANNAKANDDADDGWTSDDNLFDDFILEPGLQGLSWGELCDESFADEEAQNNPDDSCNKSEPAIGSGGASMWSHDEFHSSSSKALKRPTYLAAGYANSKHTDEKHHGGKRHGNYHRHRRARSPCEGIGEQDLANARQARQLIISSPEKPIIKFDKWPREEGKHSRDQKIPEYSRGHEEKHKDQRNKTSYRDTKEFHGEASKHSHEQNYERDVHHNHDNDNHHNHKYGSGHRRRNKRDTKPF